MTKEFLLHKDKKENKDIATKQMAHLVLPSHSLMQKKPKEPFLANASNAYPKTKKYMSY